MPVPVAIDPDTVVFWNHTTWGLATNLSSCTINVPSTRRILSILPDSDTTTFSDLETQMER